MLVLHTSSSTLLTQWQGPFEITLRVEPVDYEVHWPGHPHEKQIYRVNLLWEWYEPEGWAAFMEADMEDLGPQGMVQKRGTVRMEDKVQIGKELSPPQRHKMQALVREFTDVFHEEPGWVQGTYHTIQTPIRAIVQERCWPLPHHLLGEVWKEIDKMLEQGIIQPSRSSW